MINSVISCIHFTKEEENEELINYESIDITLYDNSDITIPKCNSCSTEDNILVCLICGILCCNSDNSSTCNENNNHSKLHYKETGHSLMMSFQNYSEIWCFKCNSLLSESYFNNKNQIIINNIKNLFNVMKLFIYFDKRYSSYKYNDFIIKNNLIVDYQHLNNNNNNNNNILINDNSNNINNNNNNNNNNNDINYNKINNLIKIINSKNIKNIIVLTGAGISVKSGIPDFRSPNTGLYNNLQKFNLPFKEAIFDIDYFKCHPEPFYVLSKELYPGRFIPTETHYFIKLLSDKGLLLRNYTQNIDTLERLAGVPNESLVEAHGSFQFANCINKKCNKEFAQDYIKKYLFNNNNNNGSGINNSFNNNSNNYDNSNNNLSNNSSSNIEVPRCDLCNSIIKPGVVFFGDPLPTQFNDSILNDINKCDMLIVIGTSLKVAPINSMVHLFQNIPRLLINNESVGENNYGGFDFINNPLDFKLIGDCQECILEFTKLLNWDNELINLIKDNK